MRRRRKTTYRDNRQEQGTQVRGKIPHHPKMTYTDNLNEMEFTVFIVPLNI